MVSQSLALDFGVGGGRGRERRPTFDTRVRPVGEREGGEGRTERKGEGEPLFVFFFFNCF